MTLRETFDDALESLRARKLRASLSMLGMIFGVGAVIAMLAIGEGAEHEALALIERLGLRNVVVEAKDLSREDLMEIRKKSPGLSLRDRNAILEAVTGVEKAVPRVKLEPYRTAGPNGRVEAVAYGVSHEYFGLETYHLSEGRFLDAFDEERHAQVAVIGAEVSRRLFGHESGLGESFKLDDLWLEVVGILAEDASARQIYLPFSTALRKLDHPPLDSPLDQILVEVEADTSPWEAATAIDPLLSLLHGGADDYRIVVPEALLEQSRATKRLFNLVMGAIAGISLLVGAIGILTMMWIAVGERTSEIGLIRAVGASRGQVRAIFLTEAAALATGGGALGLLGAMGLLALVRSAVPDLPVHTPGLFVLLALGVSFATGIISGVVPASRASELDPIEALRSE